MDMLHCIQVGILGRYSDRFTEYQPSRGLAERLKAAAGMIEAGKQFRRVNGHLHLPGLRVALDAYVAAQTVGAIRHDEPVIAA